MVTIPFGESSPFRAGRMSIEIVAGSGCGVGCEIVWIKVLTFVFEVLDALWGAFFLTEPPYCFVTSEPRSFVGLFVVAVPGVAVFAGELAVPHPVWGVVDAVDVDVTALTQRDHVFDAVIGVVAVDVMQREFVLTPLTTVCLKPFFGSPSADNTGLPPAVKYCFL
jgi:hypothetical protein